MYLTIYVDIEITLADLKIPQNRKPEVLSFNLLILAYFSSFLFLIYIHILVRVPASQVKVEGDDIGGGDFVRSGSDQAFERTTAEGLPRNDAVRR